MPNFTAGTSFTDGVTNDVTAAKLNALIADAVPTSSLSLNSTTGTISQFSSGTGTAASPAIQPTGDTNTGIFFPAADTVALSTQGTEAMRIASSGNVGIGTTSPATAGGGGSPKTLEIYNNSGSVPWGQLVLSTGSAGSTNDIIGGIEFANRGVSGAAKRGATIYAFKESTSTANADTYLQFSTNNSGTLSERLRIDSSGNVGIGTTSPSTKLDVLCSPNAGIRVTDGTQVGIMYASGVGGIVAGTTSTHPYILYSNNTERLRIDFSGNVILTGNKSLISRGAGGVSTNSAIGDGALQSNTTGYYNLANGVNALYSNTTGYSNTANGFQALYSNTTGYQNTANGVNALLSNTTGFDNTANGVNALYSNTTGYSNTANGFQALYSNTTGYQNTANGFQAGYGATGTNANTTGSNNTFIGNEAVGSSATASNVITLGNSAIAALRCQVTTITALSDRRDKKDIVPLDKGLGLINALNPVSFVWNMRDGKKVGIPEIGFIAQELEEAQKQSGLTVPNLVYADNPERLEASPSTLIPILVRAVQELSHKVSQLEAKLKE